MTISRTMPYWNFGLRLELIWRFGCNPFLFSFFFFFSMCVYFFFFIQACYCPIDPRLNFTQANKLIRELQVRWTDTVPFLNFCESEHANIRTMYNIWNVLFGISARSSRHPRGVHQSTGSVTTQNGPDNTRYGNFLSFAPQYMYFSRKSHNFKSVIKWVYWRRNVVCSRELAAHGKLFRRAL